ncbi:hypothetical protein [Vulcanisaeta sp. JCM 16159]|uniref:hypothetical protein n=1 Tax=Vulcanisaeta sp. JCM 16159 TaxID=1295371 RepID=UPI000AB00702|nr:hypothetical protein [Vulcanisaeta sp. JCM 16159]
MIDVHVSKPMVIGEELIKHYIIEIDGVKTDIDVYRVVDPQYGVHDYIAYVVDNVPDWAIALPIEKIVELISSGWRLGRPLPRDLRKSGLRPVRITLP